MTDFERAVFSASEKIFPDSEHKGCRFHHNAAVWKKIGEHGLQSLFYQNPTFQEVVYKMYALTYVPEDKVVDLYEDLILKQVQDALDNDEAWIKLSEELDQFGYYYRNTWVEKRNGRPALFSPSLWNNYKTVVEGGIETNNMVEAFNRTWNSLAGLAPNVWRIQELFVKAEADARRSFMSNSVGQDMNTNSGRRQKSMDARQRIKFLAEHFRTTPPSEYLQMVAHEIQKAEK